MFCRNCNSSKLKKIVSIGSQPISSKFNIRKKFNEKKYSLDLFKCKDCSLIQLGKTAPLSQMYGSSYGYRSGISKLMISHLKDKYHSIKKNKKNCNRVLDVGSNDGTFLNFFSEKTFKVGIDPSIQKFKKYYDKNIFTIDEFFSKKNIFKFFKKKGKSNLKFDMISSFAIFYDIENPNRFCEDIYNLLDENGIWILEFSYLPLMLKNLTFDQICHEHVTYYGLKTFKKIAKKNNLKIIDAKLNEINGGSIEVTCAKIDSKFKESKNKINKILNDENKITENSFKKFNSRIKKIKKDISQFLKKYKQKKIIGYGASTKGNVVLNYCSISNKDISYICDANKFKFNKYTPGSNIKIISKNKMRVLKPDFLLVLIWPFRKEVINQEVSFIKSGGSLIFLLPKFHIVDKTNYKKYLKASFKPLSYSY